MEVSCRVYVRFSILLETIHINCTRAIIDTCLFTFITRFMLSLILSFFLGHYMKRSQLSGSNLLRARSILYILREIK